MESRSVSHYRYQPSLKGRLTAIALSLAICALILLGLIWLGLVPDFPGGGREKLVSIALRSEQQEHAQKRAATKAVQAQAQQAMRQQVVPPAVRPPTADAPLIPGMIKLTRDQFASADIGRMAKPAKGADDSGGAPGSGAGEGPGGARLYRAEWYREPTHAEMATYLPQRDISGGWAIIACKTQEQYRVDDCRELAESPPGSGLSRALRQAAWQFLVRPPRIDGKPLIGAWVSIRFEFTRAKGFGGDDDSPGPD